MIITKRQLVTKLAGATDSTKVQAERSLDSLLKIISDALTHGDTVSITNFGKFTVRTKKPRQMVIPSPIAVPGQENKVMHIPQKAVPAFRPSEKLKREVMNAHADKSA